MMGIYLSHMRNLKEDPTTGRVPDLNYAREITQLFSVGEYKLNIDGSAQIGSDGRPVPAYNSADLSGLSQVFKLVRRPAAHRPYGGALQRPEPRPVAGLEADARLQRVHAEHKLSLDLAEDLPGHDDRTADQARYLGDAKIALDTLFNNPNVGPFVGKQLIQRLVTSNPSPAYVSRVAMVFNDNDNGKGVRGDLMAVWKAILLDPEARTVGISPSFGKVREPLLRPSGMLRAFNAQSISGRYSGIGLTDDPSARLNQTPMFAPTAFNFFRPGYVPTSDAIPTRTWLSPSCRSPTSCRWRAT